jgi:hypothetical protein
MSSAAPSTPQGSETWGAGRAISKGSPRVGNRDWRATTSFPVTRVQSYPMSSPSAAGWTATDLELAARAGTWRLPSRQRPILTIGSRACRSGRLEMATVGDPLLDLGWLLATGPDSDGRSASALPIEPWSGLPTRDELIARYQDVSGRELTALPWFQVLACYKLGIVLEGTHARACAGLADKPTGELLHAAAVSLLEPAGKLIAQY